MSTTRDDNRQSVAKGLEGTTITALTLDVLTDQVLIDPVDAGDDDPPTTGGTERDENRTPTMFALDADTGVPTPIYARLVSGEWRVLVDISIQ